MKWSEMTPEQRNKLVAVKIMGWQDKECDGEMGEFSSGWECTRCGLYGDWDRFDDFVGHIQLPPRYTQCMDATMELVRYADEHFEELRSPFAYYLGVTFATDDGIDTFSMNLHQWASLAPEKICIAVLKTVQALTINGEVVKE